MLAVTVVTALSVFVLQSHDDGTVAGSTVFAVPAVGLPSIPVGYHESAAHLARLPTPDEAELVDAGPQGFDPIEPGDASHTSTPVVSSDPGVTVTPSTVPEDDPNPSTTPPPDETEPSVASPAARPRKTPRPNAIPTEPISVSYAYTVKPGDTLSGIAAEYGVSVDSILWNNIHVADANELYVDQQLQIPAVDGVIYSITLGDTLTGIADTYSSDLDAIVGFKPNKIKDANSVPINTMILIPGGRPPAPQPIPIPTEIPGPLNTPNPEDPTPEAPPTEVPSSDAIPPGPAHTTDNLRLRNGSGTQHDAIVTMPVNSLVDILDAPKAGWYPIRFNGLTGWASGDYLAPGAPDPSIAPTPGPQSSSGWQWPLIGPINSYFGPSHPLGIDIGTNRVIGLPIKAAKSGTIIFAGGNPCCSYGYYVIIDHGGGWTSRYGHLSSIGVSLGQQVGGGQQIGLSGNTGYSTGPHLHFEIRFNLTPVNPLSYLP